MGLRCYQTLISYMYLASIFCMTVIKESTKMGEYDSLRVLVLA